MKVTLLTFFLFATAVILDAQSVVKVQVVEYNGKEAKTPLAHVELQVVGASSTVTNAQGEGTLKFKVAHAGDRVKVNVIRKSGYEVFNTGAVDNWHISLNSTFTIVMCKTQVLKQLYDRYLKSATEHYEQKLQNHEQQLSELRVNGMISKDQFDQQVKQLYAEYEQQFNNIENYINRFTHIDLNDLNQQEQEIISLVQQGDIDNAIANYEKMDLLNLYKQKAQDVARLSKTNETLENKVVAAQEGRDSIAASIYNQVNLLEMIGGADNYDKATRLLRELALADTTIFRTVFEYATFADRENDVEEAERFYQIALNNCPTDNLESLFKLHTGLGGFFFKRGMYERSNEHLTNATEVYGRLKGINADAFINDYVDLKIYQGVVLRNLGKLDEAMDAYMATLQQIEPYYAEDTTSFYDCKSMLHINLGNVYYNLGQLQKADEQYQLATVVLGHVKQGSFHHTRILAGVQLNISIVLKKLKRYDEAMKMMDTVFQTIHEAASVNPDAMVGYIENATITRAELLFEMGDRDAAKQIIVNLLKEMEITAAAFPHTLERQMQQANQLLEELSRP